jgi:hypothetical protein
MQQTELNYTLPNNSAEAAIVFVKQQFPQLLSSGNQLQCVAIKQSPLATYYTLQQTYYNYPVEQSIIKICIAANGKIQTMMGQFELTTTWNLPAAPQAKLMTDLSLPNGKLFPTNIQPHINIRITDGLPEYVFIYDYQFPEDRTRYGLVTDINGNLLETNDYRSYFSIIDTTVTAKVFLPDPLTTASVDYGGEYKDLDDADNDALNNERADVTMQVQFEDGIFYLRNDSVQIKDLNTPIVPVVTGTLPEFNFTRSESGFEDVNVFYHITNFSNDILNAGYEGLQHFYIEIDPHGASGADQSFYISAAVPSIQFGEGGVDDGEDADVIIHEFTHAVSDQAASLSNSGLERRAMDEGYGDYFAASYSRKFSDHQWGQIFSWDGHNEFWFGRNADTDKHYPEDNSDNYYAASEIWSGALMDIFDLIGRENTDKLVLETLYGSFPNMTMPQGAQLILAAEELLFGGLYYDVVFNALDARGLINPVAITTTENNGDIQFLNTAGFTNNSAPIVIVLPDNDQYVINCYNSAGQLIQQINGNGKVIEWQQERAYCGLLLIEVITSTQKASTTLVRLK